MKRVIVFTPVDGSPVTATVSHGYHQAIRTLERSGAVVMSAGISMSDDLVRGRSRAVRIALTVPNWEWMLHWDDDVVPQDPMIVSRMIERAEADGHDMIAAPYPRKRIKVNFPYKPLAAEIETGKLLVKNDCMEVELIGFGFVLTSRKCLEGMVTHYANEWFTDAHDPANIAQTVALFGQLRIDMPNGWRDLYSEDYSFCHRWRAVGGKIQMFVGEGSPLAHIGGYAYTGKREELGEFR